MGIPGSANPMLFGGAAAYQINQSLRFNKPDATTLQRTPASTTNQKTFTFSFWAKLAGAGGRIYVGRTSFNFPAFGINLGNSSSGGPIVINQYTTGGVLQMELVTASTYRDFSSWYHVVCAFDTTQATASNRIKIYVNGQQVTAFSTSSYPSQNLDLNVNTSNTQIIGGDPPNDDYWAGYLAEYNFIDGTALTPSSFGETDTITGAWIPKKYSGSYGTNGFYLKFESSGIGTDSSGNSNTWTANNFSTSGTGTDVMSDTPTNNWCTLNPISSNASLSLSNGNLDTPSTQDNKANNGTIGVSSGKWYWEATVNSNSKPCPFIGVTSYSQENDPDVSPTINSNAARSVVRLANAFLYKNYTGSSVATGATNEGTTGTIGIALNFDAGEIKYYRDNTLFHTDTTIPTNGTTLFPYIGVTFSGSGGWQSTSFNFGQRAFAYTPPTGFKALNTANLPEPTIKKGSKYFDTKLYTGTNATLNVTGFGFSPDLVWTKARSEADQNVLCDAVRGASNRLFSNLTNAEGGNGLVSLNSDGFTLGNASTSQSMNNSGQTYVAWAWDANGAGSSIAAGSIDGTNPTIASTVSANATAGFSIVTYTGNATAGATIGHGLGVAPKMVIAKPRSASGNWVVYHESIGNTGALTLQTPNGTATNIGYWNNTSPTSTVFSLGSSSDANQSGVTAVAYCFSEVAGYSKFGSFTSNASSDGPYVHLGFRPKTLWIKKTTGSTNANSGWYIFDSVRGTYNVTGPSLRADLPDIESTFNALDFTSNGFKLRVVDIGVNSSVSGDGYIFAAFAELPFKYANAR